MTLGGTLGASDDETLREGHVYLMIDQGLLCEVGEGTFRITSQGHDFLEAIRSETIWSKTKEISRDLGGTTLGMVREIALSLLKQKLSEQVGINI
jgi:hypothetical protein